MCKSCKYHDVLLSLEARITELENHHHSIIDSKDNVGNVTGYITTSKPLMPKKKFEAPCRFGGLCTDKKLYDSCIKDTRIKNNWMCRRDGILKEEKINE